MPFSFGDLVPISDQQGGAITTTNYKTTVETVIKAHDEILICDSCGEIIINEKVYLSCVAPIVPHGSKYAPPFGWVHPSHVHCGKCNANLDFCNPELMGKCGACMKNPALFDTFPIMRSDIETREKKVAVVSCAGQACNPNVEVPHLTRLGKVHQALMEDAKKAEETEKKLAEERRLDNNKREKEAATKNEAAFRAAQAARGHVHPPLPTAVATHPIPYGGVAVPVHVDDMIEKAVEDYKANQADPPKDKTKKPRKPMSAEKKKANAIKRIEKKYANEKNIILEFLDMDPLKKGFEKLLEYRLNRMANKIVDTIEKAMGTQMAATLNYQKKYTTEIFGGDGVTGIVDKTFDKFHDDLNNMTEDCINTSVADLEEVIDLEDSEEEGEAEK